MTAPTLLADRSLTELRDQILYMSARLSANALAASLASTLAPFITRIDTITREQQHAWDEELSAQAVVDEANDALDDAVRSFERDLRHAVNDDRTSAWFQRYFPGKPSDLVRLGLQSQLAAMRTWPTSMASDTGPASAHAPAITAAMTAGQAAVDRRALAHAATTDHRVRQILPLIDDLNAMRTGLHGTLETLGASHALPKTFADRFFRHAQSPSATPPTPTPAPAPAAE